MELPGWGQTPDFNRFQGAMQAVEQACAALEAPGTREAAENVLMSFRRSSQPIQVCQYIIGNSQMATARFQAAATLQEAAIREWALFSVQEKEALRMYCLHYAMAHAEDSEGYVPAKVLSVVAILLKRGWLDYAATEKDTFFHEVQEAVSGAHGTAAQKSGISLLEALVSEFSPSTATPMGLPAEFHEHCRASMELEYLPKFYSWALDASTKVAEKALQWFNNSQEYNICTSALRLMSDILCWDFRGNIVRGGGVIVLRKYRASLFSAGRDTPKQVSLSKLGSSWYDVLLSHERVAWILDLYSHIRQNTAWIDLELAVVSRQLIIQLCSVSGSIFSSDGNAQEIHYQRLLSGIIPWFGFPEVFKAMMKGENESELLDGCRALLAIASAGSLTSFDQLLLSTSTSTLSLLASITAEAIRANEVGKDEPWLEEALDILLEIWTVLLQPADLSKNIPISLPQTGMEGAAAVFHAYVQFELKVAETSGLEDDDDAEHIPAIDEGSDHVSALFTDCCYSARDERLCAIALIARATPSVSLSLLATSISQRCIALQQISGMSSHLCTILEQLHFLLSTSGHVLADGAQGETPVVPDHILALNSTHGDHPAVALSRCVIDLARQSLDANFRSKLLSPRLMEAIVRFFARWVDTYLMPVDSRHGPSTTPSGQEGEHGIAGIQFGGGRSALDAAFGEEGGGVEVVDVLVRTALTALTAWPGEVALQKCVALQLLPALVRKQKICTELVKLDAWKELANAFACQERNLASLAASIQRAVSESLFRSAAGITTSEQTTQYVRNLLNPLAASISSLAENKSFPTFAQQPDVLNQVCCWLERLRGAARATLPKSQKAIFDVSVSIMQPLLVFLQVYKHESSVVCLLLKYIMELVECQISFLERRDTAVLLSFCIQLLKIYSALNIGKVSISTSANVLSETQTEKYKDLRALLQLLANLSSKDLIDFASDDDFTCGDPDVAQVIYLGLHIITPLISADLLKYPKLCLQYFTLLVHMLEVYPEKIAKLSSEGFAQIVSTLDFGLRHQDVEVVNLTFTALNALAVFHYHAMCQGQEGLGSHAETLQVSGGLREGVLTDFLKSVLHYLLFEDYSNELIDPAADALLPLIFCNTVFYQKLIQELLEVQQNDVIRNRLATAFHLLSNNNQVTSSLERSNRRKFRENIYVFLSDVRGFLRTR